MLQEGSFVPELLDMTLRYLSLNDLLNCLRVNGQFNAHAYPLLFQYITLYLHPFVGPSPLKWSSHECQINLRKHLFKSPRLAPQISKLSLIFNIGSDRELVKPTIESTVEYIIKHAVNLELVEIEELQHSPGRTLPVLYSILNTITTETRICPTLSIRVIDWERVFSEEEERSSTLVRRLNSLACPVVRKSEPFLNFLRTCKSLRTLNMLQWNNSVSFDNLADIFQEIPLQQLLFNYTQFLTLPSTLKYLEIGKANFDTVNICITPDTWSAICALEHLETFKMFCRFNNWDFPHLPCFKSSKLTNFEANIHYGRDIWRVDPIIKNLITPVLEECRDLERIQVNVFDVDQELRCEYKSREPEHIPATTMYPVSRSYLWPSIRR